MKVLSLKVNGKTHLTGRITSFLSKEGMKIQKEAIALGKKGLAIQAAGDQVTLDDVEELLEATEALHDRKVWFICEVYEKAFTADELEQELTNAEIDEQINKIINGVTGVLTKN